MKKLILIIGVFLLLGAGWGIAPYGGPEYGSEKYGVGQYGSGGEVTPTYWRTAYGTMWTETYATDSRWTETYNTEYP